MNDNPTGSDLALPSADLGKHLFIAIDEVRREADFAQSMLTEAADQEEASRALVVLNNRLNELAQIGEAAAEAMQTLADVAGTLKRQRDEAIEATENLEADMEEYAAELADEMTGEFLTWHLDDVVDEEISERDWQRENEERSAIADLQSLGMADEAQVLQAALDTARQAREAADKMVAEAQRYIGKNSPERASDWHDSAEDNDSDEWDDDETEDDDGDQADSHDVA